MNEKAFKTLEFNKIKENLAGYASSIMGKDFCNKLTPISDIDEIKIRQGETSDALRRVYRRGALSFIALYDIRDRKSVV